MKTYPVVMLVVCLFALQNAMSGNWQIIPNGNGTNTANKIDGISAPSESVWTVGFAATSNDGATIMHWGSCFLGGVSESQRPVSL